MGRGRAAIEDGMTYRQVERALRRMGFRVLRHSGDHAVWGLGPLRVPVRQGHPTERVPRNTIRQMSLQARGEQPWRWGGYSERLGETMGETTGVERLRELGREQEERSWSTVGKVRGRLMLEIADQIDREQGEHAGPYDYRRIRMEWAIRGVLREMERHVSGVEGMEDSPVARWARELRGALGTTMSRHESDTVAGSPSEAMADEDREAAAWVREHFGLDYVMYEWQSRVPYDKYKEKRQRLLDHIAECETALGRRRRRIDELGHRVNDLTTENAELRKRAMPDGYEWPRYESGEPVRIGGTVADGLGRAHEVTSVEVFDDAAALHWNPDEPEERVWVDHGERVNRPAVPAGDGEPLEVGQTVWDTDYESDTPLTVVEVSSDLIRCEYTWKDGKTYRPCYPPSVLTHTKPEPPESWERIEDDATLSPEVYCHRNGIDISQKDGTEIFLADTVEPMARDLVRRCRALAERERGE